MAGYAATSRAEDGCVFFDIGPLDGDPDGVIVIECWQSAQAHAEHAATEHYKTFGSIFAEMVQKAVFDEMDVSQANTVRIGEA
jgi:quinol monooxygenase YgiN